MRKFLRSTLSATVIVIGASIASAPLLVPALAASFSKIVLSAQRGSTKSVDTFTRDTASFFIDADLTGLAPSAKIAITWIAIDTNGVAPPNYKIDETIKTAGELGTHLTAWLSRPNNGWPIGSYKVVLSVDGKVEETVNFSVR